MRRQGAAGGKSGEGEPADRRFRAARDHEVGVPQRDQPRGVAYCVSTGRTGCDHSVVRPSELMPDGDIAGGEVDQAPRNEKRADALRAFVGEQQRGLLDTLQAADTRADQHARCSAILIGFGVPAGVVERLLGGGHGVDDEIIDLALFLRLHPFVGIVGAVGVGAARNGTGDLAANVRNVELSDPARAAFARDQSLPTRLDAASERRNHAKASNDDAPHHTSVGVTCASNP